MIKQMFGYQPKSKTIGEDDDCSLSSTISVSQDKPISVEPAAPLHEPRVRFDLDSNIAYENTLYPREDSWDHWISGEDYYASKQASSVAAKGIMQAEGGLFPKPCTFSGLLNDLYESCNAFGFEVEGNVMTQKDQRKLEAIFAMEMSYERIGLERKAVRSISNDRSRRRRDIVTAMFHVQMVERFDSFDDFSEALREHLEAISLTSRLYAREIARAQAASL